MILLMLIAIVMITIMTMTLVVAEDYNCKLTYFIGEKMKIFLISKRSSLCNLL